jgi:hypothetical protein
MKLMLRRVDWGAEPEPDQLAKMEPSAQQRWQVCGTAAPLRLPTVHGSLLAIALARPQDRLGLSHGARLQLGAPSAAALRSAERR